MSLPTGSDLGTLAYAKDGQPLATYQPSTADTSTMAFVSSGQPFYAQGAGSGGGGAVAARPVVIVFT